MIDIAMKCPCGTHAAVDITADYTTTHRWSCICPRCYDGTEDSAPRQQIIGYGATPDAALADWWEQTEDAWDVQVLPVSTLGELEQQIAAERARTTGWALRDGVFTNKDQWWGPTLLSYLTLALVVML